MKVISNANSPLIFVNTTIPASLPFIYFYHILVLTALGKHCHKFQSKTE